MLQEHEVFHPLFAPSADTGAMRHKEKIRQNEIVLSGSLADYLGQTFLKGHLKNYPNHCQQVPEYADEIVTSMLSHPDVGEARLTGSIPRFIAVEEMPSHFWDVGQFFYSERQKVGAAADSPVNGLLAGLSGDAAADMDINLRLPSQQTVIKLYETIAKRYGVAPQAQTKKDIAIDSQLYQTYEMIFPHPNNSNIGINIVAGPVLSNLKITTMNIAFVDIPNNKRIFRIDVSALPTTGAELEEEKRQGKTSKQQEECFAILRVEEDHVHHGMTKRAVEVMREENEIWTESHEKVLELFLRELRSEIFSKEQFKHDFDMFLPEFSAASLFNMQLLIQKIVRERTSFGDVVGMLSPKELALCLTIDPFVTIHALRDSGIALLIPGLAHITRDQWVEILHSRHMVVGAQRASRSERTTQFIQNQRWLYLEGGEGLSKPFNGVEMFINTLQELHIIPKEENIWEAYLKLWEEPKDSLLQIRSDTHPVAMPPGARTFAVLSKVAIMAPVEWIAMDEAAQRRHLAEFAQQLFDAARGKDNVKQRLMGIMTELEQHEVITQATEFFHALHQLEKVRDTIGLNDEGLRALDILQRRIGGIALAYLLLEQFSSGLTAKHLRHLYHETRSDFVSVSSDFGNVFLDLKLYGLVSAHRLDRKDKKGKTVDVVFYSLRRERSFMKLRDVKKNKHFFSCFQEILDATERRGFSTDTSDKAYFTKTLASLTRKSIFAIEVLLSFTERDFELIQQRLGRRADTLEKNARLLLDAYALYQKEPEDS